MAVKIPLKKRSRLDEVFFAAIKAKASDVHLLTDQPPLLRVDGELGAIKGERPLDVHEIEAMVESILTPAQRETWHRARDLDMSYEMADLTRLRINLYWEKGQPALAARIIPSKIPSMEELGCTPVMQQFAELAQGLVLVTGPTGCGKSTTLASIIDYINENRNEHIAALEDPIEFLYRPKQSIISQRELGVDMETFAAGLKHLLRQDPNVVLVGEMRDPETIATTITLAETGHLVFATLHTNSASQTIDRIIDVFPANQQSQIRLQLSLVLRGIVCQQLLPKTGGGRIAAREILVNTPAIANLIREGKSQQIQSYLSTNQEMGMQTLDQDLRRLLQDGLIDQESALFHARSPQEFS